MQYEHFNPADALTQEIARREQRDFELRQLPDSHPAKASNIKDNDDALAVLRNQLAELPAQPTAEDQAKAQVADALIAQAAQVEAQAQAAQLLPENPTPDDYRAAAERLRADR